jgi:hypothetical protein
MVRTRRKAIDRLPWHAMVIADDEREPAASPGARPRALHEALPTAPPMVLPWR